MKMIPEMSRTLAFYDGDRANDALSVGWREAQVAVRVLTCFDFKFKILFSIL